METHTQTQTHTVLFKSNRRPITPFHLRDLLRRDRSFDLLLKWSKLQFHFSLTPYTIGLSAHHQQDVFMEHWTSTHHMFYWFAVYTIIYSIDLNGKIYIYISDQWCVLLSNHPVLVMRNRSTIVCYDPRH